MIQNQNDIVLTLYFPGEYVYKDNNDKPKPEPYPYAPNIVQEERKKRTMSIPFLLPITPAYSSGSDTEHFEKDCDWYSTNSIFESCGIEAFNESGYDNQFRYKMFYPSCGISIFNEYKCKEDAIKISKRIFADYQMNNPELSINDSELRFIRSPWKIYSMPIAWIQSKNEVGVRVKRYEGGVVISSNIFDTKGIDVEYVILICTMLLSYGSDILWKMKRALGSTVSTKKKALNNVHDKCALFNNLYFHPNPCHCEAELKLFEELKEQLKIKNIHNQIENAKEVLDYRNEQAISIETTRINKTLFITGYIGIVFALFSFCNIAATNIFDFSRGVVTSGYFYFLLISLITVSFAIGVNLLCKFDSLLERYRYKQALRNFPWLLLFTLAAGLLWFVLFECCGIFRIAI